MMMIIPYEDLEEENYIAVGIACIFTTLVNWWSIFHYIAFVKGGDRFIGHYNDSVEKLILCASLALAAIVSLNIVTSPWIQGMITCVVGEISMSFLSIIVAKIRGRRKLPRPLKKRDIKRINQEEPVRSRFKKMCRPPQVVRWDILGVALSGLFGKLASVPLPRCLRGPYFRWYVVFDHFHHSLTCDTLTQILEHHTRTPYSNTQQVRQKNGSQLG